MAEQAVAYKCPGCGSIIPDDIDKPVLTCPHCGSTITKAQSDLDKTLRYQEREALRKDAKEREKNKEADKFMRKWWIGAAILALIVYLMQKGIL